MKEELKEYYCLNDYIMECPVLKGKAAFLKGKKYLFNNKMITKSEVYNEHDLSDEIDFDKHFILQSEWDLLQQKSVEIPKQQLRTEAEKREIGWYFVIFSGNERPAYFDGKNWIVWGNMGFWNDSDLSKISDRLIPDFHAQQSKTDADKITILENQLRVQKGIVSRLKQKYNHQENEIEPLNSNSETEIKESQQSKEREWISVKDRLPNAFDSDENGKVLIFRNNNDSQSTMPKSIHPFEMVKHCDKDTFWMPLPKNPL